MDYLDLQRLAMSILGQGTSSQPPAAGDCGCHHVPGTQISLTAHSSTHASPASTQSRSERLVFDLSEFTISAKEIEIASTDLRLLLEAFRNSPREMLSVVQEIQAGRLDLARNLLATLKITEESLAERGGGFLGLVVAAAVFLVVVLYPKEIGSEPGTSHIEVDDATKTELEGMGVVKKKP